MSKVLKITRPDKTVHVIPMENKAFWLGYNKRMPDSARVKVEEIDEKDAENLPYIDESHVTGLEAVAKLSEKDKEIAALKAQLKAAQASIKVDHEQATNKTVAPHLGNTSDTKQPPAGSVDVSNMGKNDADQKTDDKRTAEEVIGLIKEAKTAEEVNSLSDGDERKTVQDAAAKKLDALKAETK